MPAAELLEDLGDVRFVGAAGALLDLEPLEAHRQPSRQGGICGGTKGLYACPGSLETSEATIPLTLGRSADVASSRGAA